MISVSRNIHMPNDAVSRCWSMSAKWCCSISSATWTSLTSLVANGDLLSRQVLVVVGVPGHHRGLFEVAGGRWGRSHPLKANRVPGIRPGLFTVTQRPQKVDHGQHITNGKN